MDLYTVLQERRSVRKYKSEEVSAAQLERVLEAARLAPSWKNLQCWKFVIVRDAKRRQMLAESLPENNPARRAIGETAPVVIVLCADPKESGLQDGKEYYLLDAGLAMQQLMLAAHAEGLGTCWVALFDEEKARPVIKLPADQRIVAITPLGVPEKQPGEKPRKELQDITYAEEWGRPYL